MGLFVAQGSLIAGVAPHRSGRFGTSAGRGLGAGSPVTSLRARAIRRRGGVASGATAVLRDGQMVTIHYVMKFADGEVGDDTFKRDAPATLPIGQGQLFAALEDGIKAMSEGETRTFEILCKDAYGPRDESKVQKLPASPDELEALKERVHPGKMVQLPNGAVGLGGNPPSPNRVAPQTTSPQTRRVNPTCNRTVLT